MIIKNNSSNLLIAIPLLLIIPLVQKQWFNLYLFNINNVSFYSILYYLSGLICPTLICLNSLKYYTNYNFDRNKTNIKKVIKGKALLFLVAINLVFLSFLITDYFIINFDLLSNICFEEIKLQKPDIFKLCLLTFLISILLIFKKFRLLFKKLILVNFILISFYIWYLQINDINVYDQFRIYRYFGLNDINLSNVFILATIELLYFTWSFISYKTNLSDWVVHLPQKIYFDQILNIFIFYFFIIIYYSKLT